jgi:hypothetical protein
VIITVNKLIRASIVRTAFIYSTFVVIITINGFMYRSILRVT